MQFIDRIRETANRVYRNVNKSTGGALDIAKEAIKRFNETQAGQDAAGLAYYVFFSLFPLLLVMVAAAAYIWNLNNSSAFNQAVSFISSAIPISQSLIANNLQAVLQQRGTVTAVGLIGTIWSASNAFTILSQNINEVWKASEERGFVKKRLVALLMVLALVLLLLLSLASTVVLTLLPKLSIPGNPLGGVESVLGSIISRISPLVFSFLLFLALYKWVPTKRVSWRAALWGGGIAAVVWEIAKAGVTAYMRSSLVNYQLVYGSLGSVVALLFWIYISAVVTLFCASLTAAIDVSGDATEEPENEA